jgi:hypothetical protein
MDEVSNYFLELEELEFEEMLQSIEEALELADLIGLLED